MIEHTLMEEDLFIVMLVFSWVMVGYNFLKDLYTQVVYM